MPRLRKASDWLEERTGWRSGATAWLDHPVVGGAPWASADGGLGRDVRRRPLRHGRHADDRVRARRRSRPGRASTTCSSAGPRAGSCAGCTTGRRRRSSSWRRCTSCTARSSASYRKPARGRLVADARAARPRGRRGDHRRPAAVGRARAGGRASSRATSSGLAPGDRARGSAMMQGGTELGALGLTRVYTMHVALLPALLLGALWRAAPSCAGTGGSPSRARSSRRIPRPARSRSVLVSPRSWWSSSRSPARRTALRSRRPPTRWATTRPGPSGF